MFLLCDSQNALNCLVFVGWSFASLLAVHLFHAHTQHTALHQAQSWVLVTLGTRQAQVLLPSVEVET